MNQTTFDISFWALMGYLGLFVFPFLLFYYLKLKLSKQLCIGIIRMVIQLMLVGIYLETIFKLNHPLVNIGWMFVMIFFANLTITKRSGFSFYPIAFYNLPALIICLAFIFTSLTLIIDIHTLFSARYAIPVGGMILGNILRGNIVSMGRFYTELDRRENEYIQWISMGATRQEALKPFFREAIKAAMEPQLGTMATMGLVSLPGMMTGQILGGSSPAVAVKYQIMIMTAIYSAAVISSFLSIRFSMVYMFDGFGRVKALYHRF